MHTMKIIHRVARGCGRCKEKYVYLSGGTHRLHIAAPTTMSLMCLRVLRFSLSSHASPVPAVGYAPQSPTNMPIVLPSRQRIFLTYSTGSYSALTESIHHESTRIPCGQASPRHIGKSDIEKRFVRA